MIIACKVDIGVYGGFKEEVRAQDLGMKGRSDGER